MKRLRTLLVVLLTMVGLAACSGGNDPLGNGSSDAPAPSGSGSAGATLVIGSQQYYSNEIIAEVYAQALEAKGVKVTRQFQIGQREVYLKELQDGHIDLIPEYNGNLLQYYDKSSAAKTSAEITAALAGVLPSGLRALTPAPATDQDSYAVTQQTADKYQLSSLADLAKLPQPVTVAANSEFATRPYGPDGLKAVYGVNATVTPVEDSGGPLTIKALKDGTVLAADIYTASPAIAANNLVTLADPKSLILPQQVTPLVSQKVTADQAAVLDQVDAKLTTADLIAMNQRSVDNKESAAVIAKAWLSEKGLV